MPLPLEYSIYSQSSSSGMSQRSQVRHSALNNSTAWQREFAQASSQPLASTTSGPSAQYSSGQYPLQHYSALNQNVPAFQHYQQQPAWLPSISQPQFQPDGRLQQPSGLDTIQQGWNDVFDQIEQEFTSTANQTEKLSDATRGTDVPFLDVPRNLDEALAQAQTRTSHETQQENTQAHPMSSVPGANMGWEEEITDTMEEQQAPDVPLEEEEDFDQAGFAAFYGRQWQPGGTAESRQHAERSAAQAADLQRNIHGISSAEAENLLTRGHAEMAHDQLDTARRLGYMVNQPKALRREEVGRYLFNKANPYIGLSPEQKARLMTDNQQGLQYQVSFSHRSFAYLC